MAPGPDTNEDDSLYALQADLDQRKQQASNRFHSEPLPLAVLVLVVLFVVSILNALIPPAILNPAWQIRLVATLVSNAYLPLIALVILALGSSLPNQKRLQLLRDKFTTLAVLAALGFLLLVPLQGLASWRLIRLNFAPLEQGRPAAETPLDAMEKAIKEAPDALTLQGRLTELRGPTIAPQDMARPLPELKKILLSSLQQARTNLERRTSRKGSDPRVWILIQDSIRFGIGSLALAASFAAFGKRPGQSENFLYELLGVLRSFKAPHLQLPSPRRTPPGRPRPPGRSKSGSGRSRQSRDPEQLWP
jgi:hypothetical protein